MRIISRSINQTLKIGRNISKFLKKGDIICLFGSLGAGKTVLAKGIAQGLGISISGVVSPSFTIVRQYQGSLSLSHLDLYRLDSEAILELGYEDYIYGDGVALIEWADRLGAYLPQEYLKVEIEVAQDKSRKIDITPIGLRYGKFKKSLKITNH